MPPDFPRWPWEAALACGLYAALLWWKPDAWLLVVPAALPRLDLALWAGRILFAGLRRLDMPAPRKRQPANPESLP
ncbi:MAG: hypothetical protein Q8O33_09230 [Pseudomonadota bacterium]|nr:hypothetical protein [Pseudomonadota bacterium]